jgi:hypothetical protein
MHSLMIKDLSLELDTEALSAVHGGNNSNAANNTIAQVSTLNVPVAVGATGPANTNISVTGTQNAYIDNFQFAGDSFLALPFFGRGVLL